MSDQPFSRTDNDTHMPPRPLCPGMTAVKYFFCFLWWLPKNGWKANNVFSNSWVIHITCDVGLSTQSEHSNRTNSLGVLFFLQPSNVNLLNLDLHLSVQQQYLLRFLHFSLSKNSCDAQKSNNRHKDLHHLFACHAQGPPPGFWNGVNWRALFED